MVSSDQIVVAASTSAFGRVSEANFNLFSMLRTEIIGFLSNFITLSSFSIRKLWTEVVEGQGVEGLKLLDKGEESFD